MRKDPELAQTVALALRSLMQPRGMTYVFACCDDKGGMHIVTGPDGLDNDKAQAIFAVAALALRDSPLERVDYPEIN